MKTAPSPELTLRRADARGRADLGWLDSRHTFSFADYYDPAHMGFRSLRVINDDRVAAGRGFDLHPHRDMEIMSAGHGVTHSEFNPSDREPAHFLQIWILPRERGLTPSYTEWQPAAAPLTAPKVLLVSPDGREDSATIHQDAEIYRLRLQPGDTATHELRPGRGAWLQVATGALQCNGLELAPGDGASTDAPGPLTFRATEPVEALLFDLK
ncbi:MAG: pirin family protein [Opitutales bacterium]|nr:pirin family protein [Opitutales bacterium]